MPLLFKQLFENVTAVLSPLGPTETVPQKQASSWTRPTGRMTVQQRGKTLSDCAKCPQRDEMGEGVEEVARRGLINQGGQRASRRGCVKLKLE